MTKRLKRGLIAGAVGLVLVGTLGYAFFGRSNAGASYITEQVERGDLERTVDATGEVTSVNDVSLSFDTSGTVASVMVEVGDTVSAGTLLATLESGELSADVSRAANAVAEAAAVLAQKRAGSTSEAVRVAQAEVDVADAAVDSANVALSNAQTAQTKTIASEQSHVDQAEQNLSEAQSENALENEQAERDLVNVLYGNVIAVRSALSAADEILGIDNSLANDEFENVLSLLDNQALINADNAYDTSVKSRDAAETAVYALPLDAAQADIDAAVAQTETALADASLTLLYTRQVLDATTVDTATFSFEDLSAKKADIDQQRSLVQSEQETLEGQLQTRDTTLTANANEEESLAQSLELAERTQDSNVSAAAASVLTAQATLASREADLAHAQASLAEVQAGPRSVDLAPSEAALAQARDDLAAASARLAKASILSPIDGVVTAVDTDPGEQASIGQSVITVQTTSDNLFDVEVDVPESDIALISTGDDVDLTFDAFGEDTHVPGRVQEIDPAEKVVEGVVFYKVTIFITTVPDGVELKPGMSADAAILTDHRANVLSVPQRAVLERDNGETYVRVPSGDSFEERTVSTGMRGDAGRVEVREGLEEGETVIVSIRQQ